MEYIHFEAQLCNEILMLKENQIFDILIILRYRLVCKYPAGRMGVTPLRDGRAAWMGQAGGMHEHACAFG